MVVVVVVFVAFWACPRRVWAGSSLQNLPSQVSAIFSFTISSKTKRIRQARLPRRSRQRQTPYERTIEGLSYSSNSSDLTFPCRHFVFFVFQVHICSVLCCLAENIEQIIPQPSYSQYSKQYTAHQYEALHCLPVWSNNKLLIWVRCIDEQKGVKRKHPQSPSAWSIAAELPSWVFTIYTSTYLVLHTVCVGGQFQPGLLASLPVF